MACKIPSTQLLGSLKESGGGGGGGKGTGAIGGGAGGKGGAGGGMEIFYRKANGQPSEPK